MPKYIITNTDGRHLEQKCTFYNKDDVNYLNPIIHIMEVDWASATLETPNTQQLTVFEPHMVNDGGMNLATFFNAALFLESPETMPEDHVCREAWKFPDSMSLDEQQAFLAKLTEDSFFFLEEEGWYEKYYELWIFGPFDVEMIDHDITKFF